VLCCSIYSSTGISAAELLALRDRSHLHILVSCAVFIETATSLSTLGHN